MTLPFPEGSTRASGHLAESQVADFLCEQGYELIARNITIAGAELDLIARLPAGDRSSQETIIFVEVRSREDEHHGSPLETIRPAKIARLKRAATAWLVANNLWEEVAVRFDIVGVIQNEIQWLQNAFDLDGA